MASYDDGDSMARDAALIASSQNEPLAFDVRVSAASAAAPRYELLVRLASSPPPSRRRPIPSTNPLRRVANCVSTRGSASLDRAGAAAVEWNRSDCARQLVACELGEVMGLLREVQEIQPGRAMMTGRSVLAGMVTIDAEEPMQGRPSAACARASFRQRSPYSARALT